MEKTIIAFIIFILSMHHLYCQVNDSTKTFKCEDLIISVTDKMTGHVTTRSNSLIITNEDTSKIITIIVFQDQNVSSKELKKKCSYPLSFFILAKGASNCIDKNDWIYFLFRDGTRYQLQNNEEFNCKSICLIDFRISPEYEFFNKICRKEILFKFATTEIETIRVTTEDGSVQLDLSNEQSKLLKFIINCFLYD